MTSSKLSLQGDGNGNSLSGGERIRIREAAKVLLAMWLQTSNEEAERSVLTIDGRGCGEGERQGTKTGLESSEQSY